MPCCHDEWTQSMQPPFLNIYILSPSGLLTCLLRWLPAWLPAASLPAWLPRNVGNLSKGCGPCRGLDCVCANSCLPSSRNRKPAVCPGLTSVATGCQPGCLQPSGRLPASLQILSEMSGPGCGGTANLQLHRTHTVVWTAVSASYCQNASFG